MAPEDDLQTLLSPLLDYQAMANGLKDKVKISTQENRWDSHYQEEKKAEKEGNTQKRKPTKHYKWKH